MSGKKYIYRFEEGNAHMQHLLGDKGANLAEMTGLGLPVPPGIIVTTDACRDFFAEDEKLPPGLMDQLIKNLQHIEEKTGKKYGDTRNPLLVSVRTGVPVFMPGLADTILNLGINDLIAEGMAGKTANPQFAMECYKRFLYMFGNVVLGIDHRKFYDLPQTAAGGAKESGRSPTVTDIEEMVYLYKELIMKETGRPFPQDPVEQLTMALTTVFRSWRNNRARLYRKLNKMPDHPGTAAIIQAMAYGNMGGRSCTGVAFTRNPNTGEPELYGEYLLNTQGDDIATGIRTTRSLANLKKEMPRTYKELEEIGAILEKHYRNMQHVEFVIEEEKPFVLQTRNGKRTTRAAVRIAVDMANSGLITREEAISRVDPAKTERYLHRRLDPSSRLDVIALGLPASPGAASGKVVFNPVEAESAAREGEKVILVRTETMPDDMPAIVSARGLLTSRGGMASHAAVVARGMGKPCVSGCDAMYVDYERELFTVGSLVVKKGDYISIDGSTGQVILGQVPILEPGLSGRFNQLLLWADEIRTLGVRANADTPGDAAKAREFGAQGIGLARTEHMFMAPDRLPIVRAMILSAGPEERAAALERLLPLQREDFYQIMKVMNGLPVTIRLLDPPLHEFLPNTEKLAAETARMKITGAPPGELKEREQLLKKARSLSEFNPMLGHRGCRLGITNPEIYAMQARAIFEACARLTGEGYDILPEVEIPLVMDVKELHYLRELVDRTANEVMSETGINFRYMVGTMIETPRAALLADEIAAAADFFSFGTNDLTQTALGFSRDDAEGKFLNHYLDKKILSNNPFAVLDRKGVGKLMRMAVELGRRTKPALLVGICGEHGGEPGSIEFCHSLGLDYVSCSPLRVPIARLVAAQAAVKSKTLNQ